jgi:hypothetical protein
VTPDANSPSDTEGSAAASSTVASSTVASSAGASSAGASSAVPTGPRIDVVGGNPTATEVAAVTAVLAGVLEEISGHIEADATRSQSAWARAQRPLRQPMHPGAGMWRGFSG